MTEKIRQKFKPGAVVKIPLSEGKVGFGRLLPGIAPKIQIYNMVLPMSTELPAIEEILSNSILFYTGLYKDIVTKGVFEIIGFKAFTALEIKRLPATFTQDLVNISKCKIFWPTGEERDATPEECIDFERASAWDEKSIAERIEDEVAGKRNKYREYQKVILSETDPRYMAPPNALRWDFEKRMFYRID